MKHYSFVFDDGTTGIVLANNVAEARLTIEHALMVHLEDGDPLPTIVDFNEEHASVRVWFLEEGNLYREAGWEVVADELGISKGVN